MRTCLMSLSSFLLLVLTSLAQEQHAIKIRFNTNKGQTTTYRESTKVTGAIKFADQEGKTLGEFKPDDEESIYQSTVLDTTKDGAAAKYIHTYEKATKTKDGKLRTLSLQGRTLLYEKVDGKTRIGLVGERPLDPEDEDEVVGDGNDHDSEWAALRKNLAPEKPVKVGDSWSVDVTPVAKALKDGVVNESKSSIIAKLTKVYMKGKSKFATIEVSATLVVLEMKMKGQSIKFDTPAKYQISGTVDIAIDGSSTERTETAKFTMRGTATTNDDDRKIRLVFDVTGEESLLRSAEFDDPKVRPVPKVTYLRSPGDWIELTPKDVGIRLSFPRRPKEQIHSKNGDKTIEWSHTEDSGSVYFASITEFAKDRENTITFSSMLAQAKKNKDYRDLKAFEHDGHPGFGFSYKATVGESDVEYRMRSIFVNGRVIRLFVGAPQGKVEPAAVKKYFESLQILEKPKSSEWNEFKPKDQTWSASFPGKPTEIVKKQEAITITMWMVLNAKERISFGVTETVPKDGEKVDPRTVDMKSMFKAMAPSYKNVRDERFFDVGGLPAVEFSYDVEAAGEIHKGKRRVIVAPGRVFEVVAVTEPDNSTEVERFLKSFQLIDKPKN